MIRNAVLCSVALLALAACNAPESAKTPEAKAPDAAAPAAMGDAASANVLTPLGYGPLKIGMTQAEADAAVGPPPANAAEAEPSECRYYHPPRAPEGLLVMVENGVLTRLTATKDSTVKTEDGVGVGDDGEQLKARYAAATVTPHKYQGAPSAYVTLWPGKPQLQGAYVTDPTARGLVFEIGDDGKVAFIHAGGPSIQNVEGCS
ncbi:hypothetical protein D3C72_935920 [compost metagenome]